MEFHILGYTIMPLLSRECVKPSGLIQSIAVVEMPLREGRGGRWGGWKYQFGNGELSEVDCSFWNSK